MREDSARNVTTDWCVPYVVLDISIQTHRSPGSYATPQAWRRPPDRLTTAWDCECRCSQPRPPGYLAPTRSARNTTMATSRLIASVPHLYSGRALEWRRQTFSEDGAIAFPDVYFWVRHSRNSRLDCNKKRLSKGEAPVSGARAFGRPGGVSRSES